MNLIDLDVCAGDSCHSQNSIPNDTITTISGNRTSTFFLFRLLQTKTFILTVCCKTEAGEVSFVLETATTTTSTDSFRKYIQQKI